MYNNIMITLSLILAIYTLSFPLILNFDDKLKHIKWSAIGLKNVLKNYEGKEIDTIRVAYDVELLYNQYIQERPSAKKYFSNCIIWIDAIILRINTESKITQCVAEYYDLMVRVRNYLNTKNPYSNCTQYQQGILNDICSLTTGNNNTMIKNIIGRVESEFIRLERDIRKNERSNKLSLMIGILGIAVSVILAIIKF